MNEIFLELARKAEQSEQELCELLDQMDTEALLSVTVAQLLLSSLENAIGDKHGNHAALVEVIAFYAIPRFGTNTGKVVTHSDFNQCYALAEKILTGRMWRMSKMNNATDHDLDKLSERLIRQSEIVRGSAYPEQTRDEIIGIQGKFDNWFKEKIGISPSKAVEIIFSLITYIENSYNNKSEELYEYADSYKNDFKELKKKKQLSDQEKQLLQSFENAETAGGVAFFTKFNEIIPTFFPIYIEELSTQEPISKQEADALKKLIGISKETFNKDAEIQRFPIYILNSGKVLVSEISNCFDVLFDAFEDVAKSDNKFYEHYQNSKSQWLEDTARNYLARVFPENCIYQTLDYLNPDKFGTAELDMAIKWGQFIILVEAKAKQFRFEASRGNIGALKNGLKKNIQDSYIQALRAIRYIDSNKTIVFTERNTGRKLEFDKNSIHRIYPISLSLHHLADIATQLKETCELGLFKDGNFPFSICIADLDSITKANITPEIFLHYIEKRLKILKDSKKWLGDELDLFGAYLDCRLDTKNMFKSNEERFDVLSFSGYTDKFDKFIMYERGFLDEKPDISLSLSDYALDIFQQLKKFNDNGAKWIAFCLLDLDNYILEKLAKAIHEIKNSQIEPHNFRRFSFANNEVVISIVASSHASLVELKDRTLFRAEIEKYHRKLNKSIGIGVLCRENKTQIFDTAHYIEYEWRKDEELEFLVQNQPAFIPVAGSKIPKRNDPCFCGSKLKYKKCCLPKMENNIRKGAL
jgi:hypothetical protein